MGQKQVFDKKNFKKNFFFIKFFIRLNCLKHHNCKPDGSKTGFWEKIFEKKISKFFFKKFFIRLKCLKHHNCKPDGSKTGFWEKNFQKKIFFP